MGKFSIDQLKAVKTVISHGNNCPDGVSSAMIVADAYAGFSEKPTIRTVDHGGEERANLEPSPGMMFVDFSPPEAKAQAFIDAGTLVLDHHAKGSSVQAFVAAGLGVFGDENKDPGVCGAVLAYEHVWVPLKAHQGHNQGALDVDALIVREFARLSGIRDTWQTRSPDWLKACKMAEALRFWPLEGLLKAAPWVWRNHVELGDIIWDRKTKTVTKVAERAYRWTSPKGTRVAFFQGVKLSSDVAEALDKQVDLVIGYDVIYEDGALKMIFSTRSHTDFDCGTLALTFGGGGHTKAAGFSVVLDPETSPNPYKMMQATLSGYESRAA
jgi:oligoribonuclease NrnB/cAMP/cGMP phosphodiesterase (DHH superfamily)